jgi:multiple sugar transport system substrate-binding protein
LTASDGKIQFAKGEKAMHLWKKIGAIGLTLALILTTVACGSSDSGSDEGKGEQVTIVYARGKDDTGSTQKLVEAFEKKHPNIKVKYKEMPTDTGVSHDQYVTMLSAQSSEIDVFDLDVIWPAEFAQAGYVQDLDRFIQRDNIDMSQYIQGAVEAGNFNGKQWAMPKFIDAGLLYYRKDIVKEPPKTWDELIELAKKHKGEKGTKSGFVMQAAQYEGLVCNFIEFAGSYGGRILDEKGNVVINSPETVKGLEKMIEVVKSGAVPGNILAIKEPETHQMYKEGESVLARNWPYMFAIVQNPDESKIVDKVAVAPLPKGDKESAAALGGWMIGINKYSKNKEAAWEFVKFVSGPEGQKISALYSHSPTYLPTYDDPEVQKANPLYADENFVKGVSAAIPRPVSPEYPKISEIIQVEVSKALAGKQSAKEAVKNMEKQLKEVVK